MPRAGHHIARRLECRNLLAGQADLTSSRYTLALLYVGGHRGTLARHQGFTQIFNVKPDLFGFLVQVRALFRLVLQLNLFLHHQDESLLFFVQLVQIDVHVNVERLLLFVWLVFVVILRLLIVRIGRAACRTGRHAAFAFLF